MQAHENGLKRFVPMLSVCVIATGAAVLVSKWPRLAPVFETKGIAGLAVHPIVIAVLCTDAIALATTYRCGVVHALAYRDGRRARALRMSAWVACVGALAAAVIIAAISRANGFAIGGVGLLGVFGLLPSLLLTIVASVMLLIVSWRVLVSVSPGSGPDR